MTTSTPTHTVMVPVAQTHLHIGRRMRVLIAGKITKLPQWPFQKVGPGTSRWPRIPSATHAPERRWKDNTLIEAEGDHWEYRFADSYLVVEATQDEYDTAPVMNTGPADHPRHNRMLIHDRAPSVPAELGDQFLLF